jgi:hypothetical protein
MKDVLDHARRSARQLSISPLAYAAITAGAVVCLLSVAAALMCSATSARRCRRG